jgi:predicted transcriptional regulator
MTHTLPWQKPAPAKNYYPVPKVICQLGLSPGEIAVYSFLLFCEDRKTYQCYPSYRTIGDAVGMSRNTVAKYVRQLEEKGLIRTERTTVTLKDGRKRNGSLLYTILPPEQAVEQFNRQQLAKAEAAAERRRIQEKLARQAAEAPRSPL